MHPEEHNLKGNYAEIILSTDREILKMSEELEKVNQMENVVSLNITVAYDCRGILDFRSLEAIPTLQEFVI